jgi:ketosteroid isomerase-like protein
LRGTRPIQEVRSGARPKRFKTRSPSGGGSPSLPEAEGGALRPVGTRFDQFPIFEEVRFEIEETRDAGEQVVGIGRFRARGRASGVDINVPVGAVQRVRRGKIVYTRLFSEPAEALEAAGLSE